MKAHMSLLQKLRAEYKPALPKVLETGNFTVETEPIGKLTASDEDLKEIRESFPHSIDESVVRFTEADSPDDSLKSDPLTVGVVLSGGQAPGGHNVIAGIWDALQKTNPGSRLLGFLNGPKGVIVGKYQELDGELIDNYRNTGGFHMIGTGRDKIEKLEELESCRKVLTSLGVNGLVIIGGDDSNTNAAVLAEYLLDKGEDIQVIGAPKTIDGDLKNEWIETSFGFDTATKTYSELVGNICVDCVSSGKYWYFIRLMGRTASHITLEVALQTRPNIAIISEEVRQKQMTLADVVGQIVDVICRRAALGKDYGTILIPEGMLEFLPDMRHLIDELNHILKDDEEYIESLHFHSDRVQHVNSKLSPESAKVYASLPEDIQEALLRRDKHGNVPLSQIETGDLIIDLVTDEIRLLKSKGQYKGKFQGLSSFFGYEGRSVSPSNFDANYTYTLGHAATQLIRAGLTGYTVSARNLVAPTEEWILGGVPVTAMLNIEVRKGERKPVIKKSLVDLDGAPFKEFEKSRHAWAMEDDYISPGPIQYFGPSELCDTLPKTLLIEHGKSGT